MYPATAGPAVGDDGAVTFPDPEVGGVPDDPQTMLTISSRRVGEATVLAVGGEVDLATADRMAEVVSTVLGTGRPVLIIDLTSVMFFSCAGLSVLVAAHQQGGQATHVRVVAGPVADRAITATRLEHLLPVFGCLDDALHTP